MSVIKKKYNLIINNAFIIINKFWVVNNFSKKILRFSSGCPSGVKKLRSSRCFRYRVRIINQALCC